MTHQEQGPRRATLNRHRVQAAAVALADQVGIEALSMRKLAQELGVVPMALYKHVADKEALLDAMVDAVVGEIDPPSLEGPWQVGVRNRILSARRTMKRHPWAPQVIETRGRPTPAAMEYMDSTIGMFRAGGFSVDLTHHVMHTLGGRMWGYTRELFDAPADPATTPEPEGRYPNITELAMAISHDEQSVVGAGCDDQFEFEFALDLLLNGFEQLRRQQ